MYAGTHKCTHNSTHTVTHNALMFPTNECAYTHTHTHSHTHTNARTHVHTHIHIHILYLEKHTHLKFSNILYFCRVCNYGIELACFNMVILSLPDLVLIICIYFILFKYNILSK